MSNVVRFEEVATVGGRRLAIATLNSPATLNALSLEMIRALTPALVAWSRDQSISAVVLQGAGEKAFCAGGDIRDLYDSIRNDDPSYARAFFSEEYALDHLIHTYPKPFICWAHGIVMGGGLGLMAGASHRVVTSQSRIAMPEINIGLFPDVGGSWILRRMPGRVGLFLALTAAALNAADARFVGLADFHVENVSRDAVLQDLLQTDDVFAALEKHTSTTVIDSNVRRHFDLINELMAGDDLTAIATRLQNLTTDDAWLNAAKSALLKGSPTSAALAFELWKRAEGMELADVFRMEFDVAIQSCRHHDFPEGVRALLVDKDKKPRWQPASLQEISPQYVEEFFVKTDGDHPLATLGKRI